jgi:hypothetical protein
MGGFWNAHTSGVRMGGAYEVIPDTFVELPDTYEHNRTTVCTHKWNTHCPSQSSRTFQARQWVWGIKKAQDTRDVVYPLHPPSYSHFSFNPTLSRHWWIDPAHRYEAAYGRDRGLVPPLPLQKGEIIPNI